MNKQQKAEARAAALRDNLKKRKAFIKQSAQEASSHQGTNNQGIKNAIGGGTEEEALHQE